MLTAAVITPFLMYPSVAYGGLLVNVGSLSNVVSLGQYVLSPTRYAFEALIWANWPNDELQL